MNSDLPFPPVTQDLIAALLERFPDRLPNIPVDYREIDNRIGQQQVIRFLQKQHDLQFKPQHE